MSKWKTLYLPLLPTLPLLLPCSYPHLLSALTPPSECPYSRPTPTPPCPYRHPTSIPTSLVICQMSTIQAFWLLTWSNEIQTQLYTFWCHTWWLLKAFKKFIKCFSSNFDVFHIVLQKLTSLYWNLMKSS